MSWEKVKLGDVCEIERDSIDPLEIASGTIYVGLENIERNGEFSNVTTVQNGELASSKFRFSDRHVLYGKLRPYLSKIALPHFVGVCSTDILPLLASEKIDRAFIYHYLRLPYMVELAASLSAGANLPRLSPKVLAEFEVPLPPLAEQKRLAAILDRADALRRARRDSLARLDELAQSLFLELFGDPATNPKGWEVATIKDIAKSINYGTSQKSNSEGETPYLRMNNITYSGEWNFGDLKYITLTEKDKEKYLVKAGEILFNRTNSAELVGKTAVYRRADPMAFAGYLIRVRINEENHPEYVSAFMNTKYIKTLLREMCKSIIGMANINAQELGAIKIPLPPLELQQKFAAQIEELEAVKTRARASLTELDALFASLQARAFAGELSGEV